VALPDESHARAERELTAISARAAARRSSTSRGCTGDQPARRIRRPWPGSAALLTPMRSVGIHFSERITPDVVLL